MYSFLLDRSKGLSLLDICDASSHAQEPYSPNAVRFAGSKKSVIQSYTVPKGSLAPKKHMQSRPGKKIQPSQLFVVSSRQYSMHIKGQSLMLWLVVEPASEENHTLRRALGVSQLVGAGVGNGVGPSVGSGVGALDGILDGKEDGILDGMDEGSSDGEEDGLVDGNMDISSVGAKDGDKDGISVGGTLIDGVLDGPGDG